MNLPRILTENPPEHITHFQASSNYTFLLLGDGKHLISGYTLQFLEAWIDNDVLIRIDRSNLVRGTISLKWQTGNSTVRTTSSETTTGYTNDDENMGDFMTADVKKDHQYGTPVFDLIAIATSCPNEINTQKRDKVILISDDHNITGIPAGGSQLFRLKLTK